MAHAIFVHRDAGARCRAPRYDEPDTTYAAEATPQAGASGGAPSSDDLDAILKQTQGPADAGAPAAPDAGGVPPRPGDGAAAVPRRRWCRPADAGGADRDDGASGAAQQAGPPVAAETRGPRSAAISVRERRSPPTSRCRPIRSPRPRSTPSTRIAPAATRTACWCTRKSAEKNFGFVLQFDKLKSDPNFIVPGNPDASKLFQKILNKEMPYDYYHDYPTDAKPVSDAEFAAIRSWITNLGSAETASCTGPFITPSQMVEEMAADLSSLEKTRVADTRYFTLTHLYNACSTPEQMDIYRRAVVKLLNSLSSVSDVVQLKTIDKERTIIRFNLKDVGWQPEDWEKILAVYPYASRPDVPAYDLIASQTLTPLPFVRGDFFAFAAPRAPLYYQLLDIPDTLQALEKQIGATVDQDIAGFNVKRAGFQNSGVSRNNRMIERHAIPTGYLWASYDFSGDKDRQNFFEFPLGPGDGPHAFKHQGGEFIWSLPNGMQAYYLATADGKKLDVGPNQIVQDPKQRDFSVHEGISCMSCHELGIRKDNPTRCATMCLPTALSTRASATRSSPSFRRPTSSRRHLTATSGSS